MKVIVADDAALLRAGLAGLLERLGHQVLAQAQDAPGLTQVVRDSIAAGEVPQVIITDVRMPPTMTDDGLRAAVKLRESYPRLSIMVLSQYIAPAYAATLFKSDPLAHLGNAGGYVPAGSAGSETAQIPAAANLDSAVSGSTSSTNMGESGKNAALGVPSADPFAGFPAWGGTGYLLKERVSRVSDFIHALEMVAQGGVVVDPEVAAKLVREKGNALDQLTARENEVLELMASGLSNDQIKQKLFLSPASVSKHVANVFMKLGLGPEEPNRRVRAVLAYLTATGKY